MVVKRQPALFGHLKAHLSKQTNKQKTQKRLHRGGRTNSYSGASSNVASSSRSGTARGAKGEGKGNAFFSLLTKLVVVGAAAYGASILIDKLSESKEVVVDTKKKFLRR